MKQINYGLLLIATRKYKQFVPSLAKQIHDYVLPGEEKHIFLFSDGIIDLSAVDKNFDKIHITEIGIEPYKFPYATLYRYKIFSENAELMGHCSHLLYLDVDMAIVSPVGEEILVDGLMAVRHPGFYTSDGWGSNGNSEKSTSWFPADKRKHYYAGGVQGGKTEEYLLACKILAQNIETDEKNEVMAEWHDETHWNKYCNYERPELVTEFNPSYCMVEQQHLRKSWGIADLPVKIIALAKDHKTIRE